MTEPQPYVFGQAAGQSSATFGLLERVRDRLARRLREIVEPYSGNRPTITPRPLGQMTVTEWAKASPAFTSLTLYRLHPIKGTVALRMDAKFVSLLVDRFYGGTGHLGHGASSEFTPTESRLIARLSGQIITAMVETFSDITALETHLLGYETSLAQSDFMQAGNGIVTQAFSIEVGEKDKHVIEIAYPLEGIELLETQCSLHPHVEIPVRDPVWQDGLSRRMDDVRLPAKTVLARPNLKMSELLDLKPGDVIPIHIARHLPLLVGDRVFAHGTIGEQDGRAAFMIEKLA
jgi:flagellar motor switch protein FliM